MTEPDPRIIAALQAHKGEQVSGDFFTFTAEIVEPIIREREAAAWRQGFDAGGQSEWATSDDEIFPINPYSGEPMERP